MKEVETLKPCPLCGRIVGIAEMTIGTMYRNAGTLFQECNATINCACGLSYERSWTEYMDSGRVWKVYPCDEDIVTAWNRRANG